ncbi:MAG: methionyl-tRNA formyltransferase [Clostridia bacterium]
MRIVFLGTPEIAVKTLEALISSKHTIACVVCQPDKESGRGKKIVFSPVKSVALAHNVPVYQFNKIRKEGVNALKELNADIFITFAYGQILSQEILDIAPLGTINIHASLLPKYRGAAPINWAIINGETLTGITIMHTAAGIDNGDIICKKEIEISETENSAELSEKIATIAPEFLLETLDLIEKGTSPRTSQIESESTYFPMLKKEDGKLWLEKSAKEVVNQIRGMTPSPSAYVRLDEKEFKVFSAKVKTDIPSTKVCGTVLVSSSKQGLVLSCGNNECVELLEIQAPNGKRMTAKAYLCGKTINVGEVAK